MILTRVCGSLLGGGPARESEVVGEKGGVRDKFW